MAHFLNKKYKSRISDTDYDIISLGRKYTIGQESKTEFGKSSKDYIEMNIFNTNGTLLDSIRLNETNKYIGEDGEFKINPGIIMRRNGYFSGDYEIEFNFLREVAGSSESVLVTPNNKIWTGDYEVLIDGTIMAVPPYYEPTPTGGGPDFVPFPLREIDYKYYIHQISNSKKELRLATLPIKDEEYKRQFNLLSEQQSVIYANSNTDNISFDNPNSNQSNQFTLGTDSEIKLDESMVGGDFVINDAFEIMNLENLNDQDDGFEITIGGKGANQHYGPGGDAYINRGDQDTSNNISFEDTFNQLGIDSKQGENEDLLKQAIQLKQDSGLKLFDGAFLMGFKTAEHIGGFPFQINLTLSDLNKINFLQPKLIVKLKGIDLASGNVFESESKQKYSGNGTKGYIPIPTFHKEFGALYSVEFDLTFELNGLKRGFRIFRPNLFAVIPDYNISVGEENLRPATQFVSQGFNF